MITWLSFLANSSFAAQCVQDVHPECGRNFKSYNSTFYPNLLGQWSAKESKESFSHFYSLRKMECSEFLTLFLCSTLSPACVNEDLSGTLPYLIPVPPCRQLCERALTECAETIKEFGIEIPSEMLCHNFPDESSTHPCIPMQSHRDPLPEGTLRWHNEDTSGPIRHSMQCPLHQRSVFEDWSFIDLESCTQPCKPMHHDDQQTFVIRLVVGLFASLTALVSAFAVYIFLRDNKRFQYPERPTLFFAVCYLIVSVICLIGLIIPETIVCSNEITNEEQVIEHGTGLIQGATQRPCTIIFMLFFYFSTAALCWWLALTLSWGLAAVFKWSSEAIATRSALLHVLGWAVPAILTLIGVSKQEIQGDPYLGVCVLSNSSFSRWWLSLTPLAIASSLGSVAFALGLCSLRSVKDHMEIDSGTKNKLEVFVMRMTGFSVFVLVPQLTQICLRFYESDNQAEWERNFYGENCDDLFVPCLNDGAVTDNTPSTIFIISRYLILLMPALAPLTWIANSKTLRGWGFSSGSSTMTSSSCVKSHLIEEKCSLNDSRHDSIEENHLEPPPVPHELIVKYDNTV